jgi:tetratricopeptide (TPR) repeat protein
MMSVKRMLALALLIGAVVVGVVYSQHLNRDADYRRLLATGDAAAKAGDAYAAIEAFSGALALRPDSMVAYYRRGEAYRAQRRDEEALRDLREASRLAPDATQPLVALGQVYDAQDDPAQAAVWYGRAAERLKDEDPALLYLLALARYRAGDLAAAIAPLRRAIARNDDVGQAHYLLGLVYRDTNNIDGAIAALEAAVKIAPSLFAAREELADVYRTLGRSADELAELQALVSFDRQPERQMALALAEARAGQFDAALALLAEAAADAPADSALHLARGRVYLTRAERTLDRDSAGRARDALELALAGTAHRSEGLALFGRALYLQGDPTAAERILREATTTSPVDPEAFAYLADAAERLAHPLDARDALVKLDVLEGDTALPDARAARARRIGELALRGNDAAGAADYLRQAVDGGRGDAATLGLLAQARFRAGDLAGAKAALAQALARDPQSAELQRLGRTIK